MPTCPNCKTEQSRRKNGACPHCGARVDVYAGHWYRTEIGSPPASILAHFERHVSSRLSEGRERPVPFSIPKKSSKYRRELAVAERLLEAADGSYDLVIAAIDILFADKRLGWKFRNSLLQVEYDFLPALALARANAEAEAEKRRREKYNLHIATNREDVFS